MSLSVLCQAPADRSSTMACCWRVPICNSRLCVIDVFSRLCTDTDSRICYNFLRLEGTRARQGTYPTDVACVALHQTKSTRSDSSSSSDMH